MNDVCEAIEGEILESGEPVHDTPKATAREAALHDAGGGATWLPRAGTPS